MALLKETLLKKTTSRCTICKKQVPGAVLKINQGASDHIVMRRLCDNHGIQDFVVASDPRFYWLAKGDPKNESCGCGPTCCTPSREGKKGYLGNNAIDSEKKGIFEKLSTCLALIEIVDSCNLSCPTCFADSSLGTGHALKYYSVENILTRIEGILATKGNIEILQLSGGEPTLHPQFFELVEKIRSNSKIEYLLINTNGVRFAKDPQFLSEIEKLYKKFDNIQLYLQFDGPQEEGQKELRGTDLRTLREQAILNCEKLGLPITLAMAVNDATLPYLWDTVKYALKFEHVRGVSFQPMFLSGRAPIQERIEPITSSDIILGLHSQSQAEIAIDDFTPLPCGDPNCAVIGWIFRMGQETFSPSSMGVDIPKLQSTFPDRVSYNIEDLKKCGCDNTPLGELMKALEVKESNAFRLFIKPFMDERTWDEDRIDRCCTHVIRPDGKLDSFCRYYLLQS